MQGFSRLVGILGLTTLMISCTTKEVSRVVCISEEGDTVAVYESAWGIQNLGNDSVSRIKFNTTRGEVIVCETETGKIIIER